MPLLSIRSALVYIVSGCIGIVLTVNSQPFDCAQGIAVNSQPFDCAQGIAVNSQHHLTVQPELILLGHSFGGAVGLSAIANLRLRERAGQAFDSYGTRIKLFVKRYE